VTFCEYGLAVARVSSAQPAEAAGNEHLGGTSLAPDNGVRRGPPVAPGIGLAVTEKFSFWLFPSYPQACLPAMCLASGVQGSSTGRDCQAGMIWNRPS
jgi:hypothetical protein